MRSASMGGPGWQARGWTRVSTMTLLICWVDSTAAGPSSLLLWKLPPAKHLDETNPGRDANEYIQCAGSAERMTVEVRRLAGGTYEHFVVGRGPNGENHGIEETIDWDGVKTLVAPNADFSAEEAAELFHSYYRTGSVPSGYVLRLLSL